MQQLSVGKSRDEVKLRGGLIKISRLSLSSSYFVLIASAAKCYFDYYYNAHYPWPIHEKKLFSAFSSPVNKCTTVVIQKEYFGQHAVTDFDEVVIEI